MATESTKLDPKSVYAESKAMVDRWLDENRDINAVSLRLATVYGYSPGHRLDLVVNRMVYDAVGGLPVKVNGNPARPLVHVEDVADAIVWGVENDHTGVANVVGENWRIRDLGAKIAEFCGAGIIYVKEQDDPRDYMASSTLLRAMGWSPRHTVDGSLPVLAEKTLALPAALIERPDKRIQGYGDRYVRLSALKRLIASGRLTPQLTPKEAAFAGHS